MAFTVGRILVVSSRAQRPWWASSTVTSSITATAAATATNSSSSGATSTSWSSSTLFLAAAATTAAASYEFAPSGWTTVAAAAAAAACSTDNNYLIGISSYGARSVNGDHGIDKYENKFESTPRMRSEQVRCIFSPAATTHCEQGAAVMSPDSTKSKLPSVKLQRRMTAIGHFSVASETMANPSIITFAMQLQGHESGAPPLTAKEFESLWQTAEMPQRHPRFHQSLVRNTVGGGWHFEAKPGNNTESAQVRKHITETVYPRDRHDLRSRLQHMQMDRWDYQDSLWYMSIAGEQRSASLFQPLPKPNAAPAKTLLLSRAHHALGDGASMAAALADLFDESQQLRDMTAQAVAAFESRKKRQSLLKRWWKSLLKLLKLLYGSLQSLYYQASLVWHSFWDADPWKQLQQLTQATTEPSSSSTPVYRTLSWSEVASVEQVKFVADVLERGNKKDDGSSRSITVNDVFVSCVTAALARQLQHHRQRLVALDHKLDVNDKDASKKSNSKKNSAPLPQQKCIHVAVPVHLKGGVVLPGESIGNNIGAFVVRVPGEVVDDTNESDNESVNRLYAVSRELGMVKRTPTAILSHALAKTMSYATMILPVSWISKLYAASNAGSLVVVSNNRGAPVPVHLAGRKVESIYGFVPLPPGIPVGLTVMSYAGNVSCTLTAEPWAVPDGDQFMDWVLEEYLRLLAAAKLKQKQSQS